MGSRRLAHKFRRAGEKPSGDVEIEQRPPPVAQNERDARVRHGRLVRRLEAAGEFGFFSLEELTPRRHVVEQRAHLDPGAGSGAHLGDAQELAALHAHFRAQGVPRSSGGDRHLRDRGDARQRLSPEAQGGDAAQIPIRGYLARRVALEAQQRVVFAHAVSVIDDLHARGAARFQIDFHPRGARVDAVLHQLLEEGGWALHHLARGDLVRKRFRQYAYARFFAHGDSSWLLTRQFLSFRQ